MTTGPGTNRAGKAYLLIGAPDEGGPDSGMIAASEPLS